MVGLGILTLVDKYQTSFDKEMTEKIILIDFKIFEKIAKKIKLKSQDPKKHNFLMVLDKFTKNDVFPVL